MSVPANAIIAYNYFIGKGLSPAASAGIVGNLIAESSVNPESVQPYGGAGRGIAQWSVGGRWNPALMTGNESQDLQNQLDYIWSELNTSYTSVLSGLQTAQNVTVATTIVETQYERPKQNNTDTRVAAATSVLNAVAGGQTATLTDITNPVGGLLNNGLLGGSITNATNSVLSATAKGFLGPLADKSFWLRIGEFAGGLLLIVIGLAFMFHHQAGDVIQQGINAGKTAAKAAVLA